MPLVWKEEEKWEQNIFETMRANTGKSRPFSLLKRKKKELSRRKRFAGPQRAGRNIG